MATPQQGLAISTPGTPGQPVDAIAANQSGGYITNPLDAADQGQADVQILYVNPVGPATLEANITTTALEPGQQFQVIPGSTTPISVASKVASHRFTCVSWV